MVNTRLLQKLGGLAGAWVAVQAQITGIYLPPGPAAPVRPNWGEPYRDLPWWFENSSGPSDTYDASMVWITRYNSGGVGGFEAGIISQPSPLGNQGTQSDNIDRTWVNNTVYPFSISYTWTGTDTTGTGAASITIGGITSTATTAYVNDRVSSFVNGTAPTLGGVTPPASYQETHLQRDLVIRLATVIPPTLGQSMSIGVSDLSISINGGGAQSMDYDNSGPQTALNISGAFGDATRSVGFLLYDNLLNDYRDDFVLTGNLVHSLVGAPLTSNSRLIFEVKLGDFDLNQIPEAKTWGATLGTLALFGGVWLRRRRS